MVIIILAIIINMPELCLCLYVRNESDRITQLLEKVVSHINKVFIYDANSKGDTIGSAVSFLKEKGIPVDTGYGDWKGDVYNRTDAIRQCNGDYIWILDSTDRLIGDINLCELSSQAYLLKYGDEDTISYVPKILKKDLDWKYVGGICPHLVCSKESYRKVRITGDYYFMEKEMLGCKQNIDLFEVFLFDEPDNSDYHFALAENYQKCGQLIKAFESYQKVIDLDNNFEDVYLSYYNQAEISRLMGKEWDTIEKMYLAAYEYAQTRAEPLHKIAEHYRMTNEFEKGYQYAKKADQIVYPQEHQKYIQQSVYYYKILDELSICSFYIGKYKESYDISQKILGLDYLPEEIRKRVTSNLQFSIDKLDDEVDVMINNFNKFERYQELFDFCNGYLKKKDLPSIKRTKIERYRESVIDKIKDKYLVYDKEKVDEITRQNTKTNITFSITTCKRFDLFEKTMNSFINCCKDIHLIDTWLCVDDNSSQEDREKMKEKYPFFQFIWKTSDEKGHYISMNMILDNFKGDYLLHIEDDWHFFDVREYIRPALEILKKDNKMGQVLFNINYAEIEISKMRVVGGIERYTESGYRYILHEHYKEGTDEYKEFMNKNNHALSNAYWPYFSFRPSLVKKGVFEKVGRYTNTGHFELEYARRYKKEGFISSFFDCVTCLHTGKKTWEKGDNAYTLNETKQFTIVEKPSIIPGYKFYPKKDSFGNDIRWIGNMSAVQLSKLANTDPNCLGFNTYGYLKHKICDEKDLIDLPNNPTGKDGLYVKLEKTKWKFHQGLDCVGNDIKFVGRKSVGELKKIAMQWENCVAFNTLGFLKFAVCSENGLVKSPYYRSSDDGLYVNLERFNQQKKKYYVKPICNYRKDLVQVLDKHTKGSRTWNNICLTDNDQIADYFVIINKPMDNEYYIPERSIVFQMEPMRTDEEGDWGVKSWGEWSFPDKNKFLQVRNHKYYLNNVVWHLGLTYNQLSSMKIKKSKLLSAVISDKYYDRGHKLRVDFIRYVQEKEPELIDMYGTCGSLNFKNYLGEIPPNKKEVGLLSYKYTFNCENNSEINYATEKITDAILSECLCFYWGCPNLGDWINPDCYIPLDLEDFEKSYQTIKETIRNNEWEKRLSCIQEEKDKILNKLQMFPVLERVIATHNKNLDMYFDKTFVIGEKDHREIIQLAKDRGYNKVLIKSEHLIFDDCAKKINFALEELSGKEWDILYLSGNHDNLSSQVGDYLYQVPYQGLTECYAVGYDAYDKILSGEKIDNAYAVYPWLVKLSDNKLEKLEILSLNLKRRPDRKQKFIMEMKKANLEKYTFYEAVDGKQLERTDELVSLFTGNDFGWKRGMIGCALSHYQMWQEMNDNNYLILEDDVELCDDFKSKFKRVLEKIDKLDWDLVYLGHTMYENKVKEVEGIRDPSRPITVIPLEKHRTIGGTFSYLINKKGANKLVEFIKKNGIKHGIDYVMMKVVPGLKIYEVRPQIAYSDFVIKMSDNVDSDIQKDMSVL